MSRSKRNHITADRLTELQTPQSVYQIKCLGDHCDCPKYGDVCRRGFFSLWIQAVYGLHFAHKQGIPAYVDFSSQPSLYAEPERFSGDANFWNYYYRQQNLGSAPALIENNFIESYPLRIWERKHLISIYERTVRSLILQPDVAEYLKNIAARCQQRATLGLQIRLTDHPAEVEPVAMDHYHSIMKQSQDRFEHFFIATDDQRVIELLVQEWGSKRIIYQSTVRSTNAQAVHTNPDHKHRFQLGLEVLADCYALSSCKEAVLVHSNISYAALLLNPHLPYKLLETSRSKRLRYKTSLLYWLDQWGIRKM